MLADFGQQHYSLLSLPIAIRLLVCISELLLIENLFLNLPENSRWHVALPCVLLAGLTCFDILVVADTALFGRPSLPLASARAIAMIVVAPLLVLAALRGQRWNEPIKLSRTAVFHSATLILSGSVLLSLALAGEILRQLDPTWGWVAELSLMFSGLIGIMLFLSSRSARSLMDRVVIHHFFADRYDYRKQWLSCIATLSGRGHWERADLYTRAIQAVADVVDSPSGALFLRNEAKNTMTWMTSWNMPAGGEIPLSTSLIQRLMAQQQVVDLLTDPPAAHDSGDLRQLGSVWLAVPLLHAVGVSGLVVVGPPRVQFRVDQEVYDLLGILGQEVGTYIAEQRAAEVISQTQDLHEYGKRFAFVAHDIKNISSQLGLLLSNAEYHLENPAFQRDMLGTVRSSVHKIDRLLKRLDKPELERTTETIFPILRLQALLTTLQTSARVELIADDGCSTVELAISPELFETAITHLLNNALEAAPDRLVAIHMSQNTRRITIDITDHGNGMSAEFVRNELFSPFKTNKHGGSGIGAFQARELITSAGGELLVISQKGSGTTMRVIFPLAATTTHQPPGLPVRAKVG